MSAAADSRDVLTLNASSLLLLNHHLSKSLAWRPCSCPSSSPLRCNQTVHVAVARHRKDALDQVPEEFAHAACQIQVISPLNVLVALRGPPLATDEDLRSQTIRAKATIRARTESQIGAAEY
ncbi:unnamed protein product [Polarella glacialis]|uniref:Uncharacterized protein n=1 Tax=Polarella glacialis TaxID=89957 RepID=A0A813D6J8_POLGL|nr:unnamed protein product [Polarella glacialis]